MSYLLQPLNKRELKLREFQSLDQIKKKFELEQKIKERTRQQLSKICSVVGIKHDNK